MKYHFYHTFKDINSLLMVRLVSFLLWRKKLVNDGIVVRCFVVYTGNRVFETRTRQ